MICMNFCRYGELELSLLTNQIETLDLHGAVSRGVGARGVEVSETVGRMKASIPLVALSLESAVERCMNFTGGSEAELLLQTLDEVMRIYLAKLQDMLRSLRIACGVDLADNNSLGSKREAGVDGSKVKKESNVLDMVSDEEEWAIVQGILQVLAVAESLNNRMAVFEATLRATLNRLGSYLDLSNVLSALNQATAFSSKSLSMSELIVGGSGGNTSFDTAILRLVDKPEKARRLNNLLEQVVHM